MRVLFTPSGWPQHFFPMVPTAWALAAAGHQVHVTCAPSFAPTITAAGLPAVPVCIDTDMTMLARLGAIAGAAAAAGGGGIPVVHPVTGEELPPGTTVDLSAHLDVVVPIMDGIMGSLDNVVAHARDWRPDLVISDLMCPDGIVAARAAGVPALWQLWGPVGPEETEPGLEFFRTDGFFDKAFARHGLPVGGDLAAGAIDIVPPAIAPTLESMARLPVRCVPYNGPAVRPAFLGAPPARRRVALVWGTSLTPVFGTSSFLLPAVLEVLAGEDVEVVVALSERDRELLGPDLPVNVVAAGRVPLNMLLPSCHAVVHHGGAGSVMTAVDAGIPQLSLTFAPEQAVNARRIETAGAGLHLPGREIEAGALRDAVRGLLAEPSFGERARELRRQALAMPTPAQLVGALETLAAPQALAS